MRRKNFVFLLVLMLGCTLLLAGCNIFRQHDQNAEVYTVTFLADGEQVGTQQYTEEDRQIIEPDVPEKTGYTGAWEEYSLTTGDITVNAVYTPIAYTVTFLADGEPIETQQYTVEDRQITEPTVPEKTGYTGAWEDYTLTTGNITVNAVYAPIVYTVTFMADGEQIGTQPYTVNDSHITEPDVPEKAGYTGAWETYELTTGDLTVNAVYTPVAYTVTFLADGESAGTRTYTVENKQITPPAVPEKTGYTGTWEDYTLTTGDLTVNAVYTAIEYTVTFMADNLIAGTRTYTVESPSISAPAVPYKTGYTGAWEDYTLTTGNLTVHAVYIPIEYTVTFLADGESAGTRTYTVENKQITPPAVPEKTGYTGTWEEYTLTTGNLTVNAVYTAIEYTVTFMAGSEQVGTRTYTVESTQITPPAVPEKTGYTGAWEDYILTTGNLTVNAVYTPVVYTVTFMADSEQVGTQQYTVENRQITEPAVPEKTGYTGVWENYTLTTGNLTVNAVYTAIEYTIVYQNTMSASNPNAEHYTIESETFILADLTANGYKFLGWYRGEEKVTQIEQGTTGGITLTAQWEMETYTLTFVLGEGEYAESGNAATYDITTEVTFVSPVSTRETYTFAGWFTRPEGGEKVSGLPVGSFGNRTYYAQYSPVVYTIQYVLNGGTNSASNPKSYTVESSTITLSAATRTNYLFDGWYSESSYTNVVTHITNGSSGNLTLYAKWTAATTVNLYLQNSLYASYQLRYGESKTLPTPTVSGQYFFGWYNTQGTKITSVSGASTPTQYTYYGVAYANSSATPIFTASQLKNIGTSGVYFLAYDINASTLTWEPIGTENAPFTGSFDGNSYKITGLRVTLSTSSDRDYAGMFGYNSGTIKNLGLSGISVTSNYNTTCYVGGLVAYNQGTVENCYIASGSVSATNSVLGRQKLMYVGGIAGYLAGGSIKNCYTSCSVSGTTPESTGLYAYCYVGGVVGYTYNTGLSNCYATGSVSSNATTSDVCGGIVGHVEREATISECYFSGRVTSEGYAGGIAGRLGNGVGSAPVMQNCYSVGTVSGNNAGGLCGTLCGTIRNSYAGGSVTGTSWASGITGGAFNRGATVECCYATASIRSTGNRAATICSAYLYITVTDCYYLSTISLSVSSGTTYTQGTAKTLSEIRSYMSSKWSSSVWDFSTGGNPVLKNT